MAAASAPSAKAGARRLDSGFVEQGGERDAGPLAARDKAVDHPGRHLPRLGNALNRLLPEHSMKRVYVVIG